jgi:hypothetical protein
MLESNAPIIPVFYRVKPAEVRWMLGLYGEYLQKHETKGRYDPNTIKKWRNALHQVASNSGFELETCNGEELVLELLDKVVKCLSEMTRKPDLYVAEYPTGLDCKLEDFKGTVLLQQKDCIFKIFQLVIQTSWIFGHVQVWLSHHFRQTFNHLI